VAGAALGEFLFRGEVINGAAHLEPPGARKRIN
jgi:hypothetical protein